MRFGDLEFLLLNDGTFRLDGGAMFGVIPKPMWEKKSRADERNRILLAMNSLLIRAAGKTILVETGAGDKWDAKRRDIYALRRLAAIPRPACGARSEAGKRRHRHQHAFAFRPLRLEHAHRKRQSASHISQRALRRAERRFRAREESHRARSRQLFARKLSARRRGGPVVAARRRHARSCRASPCFPFRDIRTPCCA